jgi:hypothetical protein
MGMRRKLRKRSPVRLAAPDALFIARPRMAERQERLAKVTAQVEARKLLWRRVSGSAG